MNLVSLLEKEGTSIEKVAATSLVRSEVMESLKVIGQVAGKVVDWAMIAYTGWIVIQDIKDHQYMAAVSNAGSFAGMMAGMQLGAAVGVVAGPIGSLVAGAIGGFAGGLLGGAVAYLLPFGNHLNEEMTLNGLIFNNPIVGIPEANSTIVLPPYLNQLMPNVPAAFWRQLFVEWNDRFPMNVKDMYRFVDAQTNTSRPVYNRKWEEWQACRDSSWKQGFCMSESSLNGNDMYLRDFYQNMTFAGMYLVTSVKPVCGILDYRTLPYGFVMACPDKTVYRLAHNGSWIQGMPVIDNVVGAYNLIGYDMEPATVYNNENYMIKSDVSEVDCGRICDNDRKCRGFIFHPVYFTCFFKESMSSRLRVGKTGYFTFKKTSSAANAEEKYFVDSFEIHTGIFYWGRPILTQNSDDAKECPNICLNLAGCVYFYFDYSERECRFYRTKEDPTSVSQKHASYVKIEAWPSYYYVLQGQTFASEILSSLGNINYTTCIQTCDSRYDCVAVQYTYSTRGCEIKGESGYLSDSNGNSNTLTAFKKSRTDPKYEVHVGLIHRAVSQAMVKPGWKTPVMPALPSGSSLLYYDKDALNNSLPDMTLNISMTGRNSDSKEATYINAIQKSFMAITQEVFQYRDQINQVPLKLSGECTIGNTRRRYLFDLTHHNLAAKYILNSMGYIKDSSAYHYSVNSDDQHVVNDKRIAVNYAELFSAPIGASTTTMLPIGVSVDYRKQFNDSIQQSADRVVAKVNEYLRYVTYADGQAIRGWISNDKKLFQFYLRMWGMLSGENRTLYGENQLHYGLDGLGSAVIVLDGRTASKDKEEFSKWVSTAWLNFGTTSGNGKITWNETISQVSQLMSSSNYFPEQTVITLLSDDSTVLPSNYLETLKGFSDSNYHVVIPNNSAVTSAQLGNIVMAPISNTNDTMHPVLEGVMDLTYKISRSGLNLIGPSTLKTRTSAYLSSRYATA